jgi:hypothetical protein
MQSFDACATAGDNNSTTAMATIRMFGMIESRTCSICPGNPIAAWVGHNETRVLSLAIKLDVRCAG